VSEAGGTRPGRDGAGRPIEVRPLAEVERGGRRYVLGAPVVSAAPPAPGVVLLYSVGDDGVLAPVTDAAAQDEVAAHLLGRALLPGAPVDVDLADGTTLSLRRVLGLTVDGVDYEVLARPQDGRELLFRAGPDGLALVEDPAEVQRVRAESRRTLDAFAAGTLAAGGAAPEAAAEADAAPSLEEGRALLAELEGLIAQIPPAHHPGAEYQHLARLARELREGLARLEPGGPAP
jgi:hypothetical protein